MTISIANNKYYRRIIKDGKISTQEIAGFNRKNSGLSEKKAKRAREYLKEIKGNYSQLNCKKINIAQMQKSINGEVVFPSYYIGFPGNVSKMGSSNHWNVFFQVKRNIAKSLGVKLADVESHVLTEKQFKSALFSMVRKKLGKRLKPKLHATYRKAFYEYLNKRKSLSNLKLTVGNLYHKLFSHVIDFLEESDIPETGEASNQASFSTVTRTAQGPFSTTCGIYAVISQIEKHGKLIQFKQKSNLKTYGDLDRYTSHLLINNAEYPNSAFRPFNEPLFRSQGLSMERLTKIANNIGKQLSVSFTKKQIKDDDCVPALLKKYPEGIVVAIDTKVGPHAVNVIAFKNGNVVYYDPIGKDGRNNVKTMPEREFVPKWQTRFGMIVSNKLHQ